MEVLNDKYKNTKAGKDELSEKLRQIEDKLKQAEEKLLAHQGLDRLPEMKNYNKNCMKPKQQLELQHPEQRRPKSESRR